MGLVAVRYPALLKVKEIPSAWKAKNHSEQEWQDFLKLALDFFVRGGGSLEIRDELWPWLELPRTKTGIVTSATEEVSRWQRRWPCVRRSGKTSILVRVLAHVLQSDMQRMAERRKESGGCDS